MSKGYGNRPPWVAREKKDEIDTSIGMEKVLGTKGSVFAPKREELDIHKVVYFVIPSIILRENATCLADYNEDKGDHATYFSLLLTFIFESLKNTKHHGQRFAPTPGARKILKGHYEETTGYPTLTIPGEVVAVPAVNANAGNQVQEGQVAGEEAPAQTFTKYLESAYMINQRGGRSPKISVTVVPLFRHFPTEDSQLTDVISPSNLRGWLITLGVGEKDIDLPKLFRETIDANARAVNENYKKLAQSVGSSMKQMVGSSTNTAGVMHMGEVSLESMAGLKIHTSSISAAVSPAYYLANVDHVNELIQAKYVAGLDQLVPRNVHTTTSKSIPVFMKPSDIMVAPQLEGPGLVLVQEAATEEEKEAKLTISHLSKWELVSVILKRLGVCEEQRQPIYNSQTLVLKHPGHHLGFSVPPELQSFTTKLNFPHVMMLRMAIGSNTIAKVKDVARIRKPSLKDTQSMLSHTSGFSVMPNGKPAYLYLPHEVVAVQYTSQIKQSLEEMKTRSVEAMEARGDLITKILQDLDATKGQSTSRVITNCEIYFRELCSENYPMASVCPIDPELGHVGNFLMNFLTRLQLIGVHNTNILVFMNWMSMTTLHQLSYTTMFSSTPFSLLLSGPPETGKTTSVVNAENGTVPGTTNNFSTTTLAALKSFSKCDDMVPQTMLEAMAMFTESARKLSTEDKDKRTLIQTYLTDKYGNQKKFHEVATASGEVKNISGNAPFVIRMGIDGPRNSINMPDETKDDPLLNRIRQLGTAPITPPLGSAKAPPMESLDVKLAGPALKWMRKMQCLHVIYWAKYVTTGICPPPDLSLFFSTQARIAADGLFLSPSDRVVSAASVFYSGLVCYSAIFDYLGPLSPLLSFSLPEEIEHMDNDEFMAMSSEELAEKLIQVSSPFIEQDLLLIDYMMAPNREATMFVLSNLYLWDSVVTTELASFITSSVHFSPELVRRCVQLRDRELLGADREDNANNGITRASLLYQSHHEMGYHKNLRMRPYYHDKSDDQTFYNNERKRRLGMDIDVTDREETDRQSVTSKLEEVARSRAIVEKCRAEMEYMVTVLTVLKTSLFVAKEKIANVDAAIPIIQRKSKGGSSRGIIPQSEEEDDVPSDGSTGSQTSSFEKDARTSQLAKFADALSIITTDLNDESELAFIRQTKQLVEQMQRKKIGPLKTRVKEHLEHIHDQLTQYSAYVGTPISLERLMREIKGVLKIYSHEAVESLLELVKPAVTRLQTHADVLLHEESHLEKKQRLSSLPTTPTSRLANPPKFKYLGNRKWDPNYVEITYASNTHLAEHVHRMLNKSASSRFRSLTVKELFYYLIVMMKTKIKHKQLPDITAPIFTASALGTLFDPKNQAMLEDRESFVVVLEESFESQSNTPDTDEDHAPKNAADTAPTANDGQPASTSQGKGKKRFVSELAREVDETDRPSAKSSRGGAASENGTKRGWKRAWISSHYIHTIESLGNIFMEVAGSEFTIPGRKLLLGIPDPRDVRCLMKTTVRTGSAPTKFRNPLYIPKDMRRAIKPMKTLIKGMDGNLHHANAADMVQVGPANEVQIIDLGKSDEERFYVKRFLAKWSMPEHESYYPSYVADQYKNWTQTHLSGVGRSLSYPDKLIRKLDMSPEDNDMELH